MRTRVVHGSGRSRHDELLSMPVITSVASVWRGLDIVETGAAVARLCLGAIRGWYGGITDVAWKK
ncbi:MULTISPECIES: hypothetical protein [Streptomyces]|uniref:hypothetical protein n=1 Tax=Streptomyces TaxID=1883 RepID=UPI002E7A66F4|nr:hypothetical protein [Streptomyces sp. SP18BB07]MEE1763614.1 hypothetical protein [Streptomyces sp. SP18BB07]